MPYFQDPVGYELAFDLSNGTVVYRQTLPFTWTSFRKGPKLFRLLDLDDDTATAGNDAFDLVAFQYDLLDAINTVNGALSTRHIVPPFSAHALLIGDRTVRTFDGKIYSLPECRGSNR